MSFAVQFVSWVLWFPLNALALSALLRLGPRRYPLLFCYLTATFLIAAVQVPIAFNFHRSTRTIGDWFQAVNAGGEIAQTIFMMAVVSSFIYHATARLDTRRVVRALLIGGGTLLMGASFLVHYGQNQLVGVWLARWTRDVHFGAAILDLAAWGLLVASRQSRESRILLLAGGMGIMFAGEAAARALQSIAIQYRSANLYYSGHLVKVLADCAFFYICWQAFRGEGKQVTEQARRAALVKGE